MNLVCHIAPIVETATKRITVDVGGLDSPEIPSHCPTEQSNLNRGKDKLKEQEDRIAVDPGKVLPGESKDVVRMRDVAVGIGGAPARLGRCHHP